LENPRSSDTSTIFDAAFGNADWENGVSEPLARRAVHTSCNRQEMNFDSID
jgi:hypothetical protein